MMQEGYMVNGGPVNGVYVGNGLNPGNYGEDEWRIFNSYTNGGMSAILSPRASLLTVQFSQDAIRRSVRRPTPTCGRPPLPQQLRWPGLVLRSPSSFIGIFERQ